MPKKSKTSVETKKPKARERKSINILVIDDEKNLTQAMRRLLSAEGYRTETACSGQEGLKAAEEIDYDVIFLDVNMPDMNGLETFKKLRKISPKSVVVMITGYGRTLKALVEEACELGVRAVIDKPFKISQITDAVKDIIPHAD